MTARMMRVRTFGLAGAIALWCASVSVVAQTVAVSQLAVTGAVPDAAGQTLTITGVNFGASPFVTLDLVPLTLTDAGDTRIVATVPISVIPPGQYLLTVSRGPSPAETGSFQVTLGPAKPQRVEPEKSAPVRAPASPAAGAEPAIQVGDRVITVTDVDREWRRTDPASYIGLSRQMYEMRRRIADTMAADELLAREAATRGLTIAALLEVEIPKRVITTPDSAVLSMKGSAIGHAAPRWSSCGRHCAPGCSASPSRN